MDNALVLAMMVLSLPEKQRKKALLYGIWGAFIFRAIAVLLAFILIKLWWFKAIGGAYLLYVAYSGLRKHPESQKLISGKGKISNFWSVIIKVELMDIAFSVDSILAAVALTDKYWLIITGGILGIAMMRFTASFFIKLLERYPALKKTAYVLLVIIGLKLIVSIWWHAPEWLFFGILFLILFSSFLKKKT